MEAQVSDLSPEAEAAFQALHLLARWLPTEAAPVATMGLELAKRALSGSDDPIAHMRMLLEAQAQAAAREKWG